jgi:hypothetical protein
MWMESDAQLRERILARPPRVRYELVPVLLVRVVGERHPKGFPYMPNDGGIVHEFLKWQGPKNGYPVQGMSSGGGSYHALHEPEHEDRIRAFLESQGCAESVECRHCGRMVHPSVNTIADEHAVLRGSEDAGGHCPVCGAG